MKFNRAINSTELNKIVCALDEYLNFGEDRVFDTYGRYCSIKEIPEYFKKENWAIF